MVICRPARRASRSALAMVFRSSLTRLRSWKPFLVGHFAPAELKLDAQLVPVVEKALGTRHLDPVIVLFDPDAELDLLELGRRLEAVLLLLRLISTCYFP